MCECGRPKLPGRGRRYCADCKAAAVERKKADAIRRWDEWRAANQERVKERRRIYYTETAERQRERARKWHHANKARASERARRYRAERPEVEQASRLRKYGLTPEEYDNLLTAQGGGCAICGRTENGKRGRFDVDHDHETGQVRGLLCNRCNRLLSNALDDPDRLRAAIEYLERATCLS